MKKIVEKIVGVLFISLGSMFILFPSLIECIIKHGILMTIIYFLVATFSIFLIYCGVFLLISKKGGADHE